MVVRFVPAAVLGDSAFRVEELVVVVSTNSTCSPGGKGETFCALSAITDMGRSILEY